MFWRKSAKKNEPNSFEATMPVDNPDIKIVQAKLHNKPFLVAVGISKQREISISGKGSAGSLGAAFQTQKEVEWQILINQKNLHGFKPLSKKRKSK